MILPQDLKVTAYARVGVEAHRAVLLDVYEEVYGDRLDDPFFSASRYWERLQAYASRGGFSLVLGELDGEVAGYALGYTLPAGSGWWRGLRADVGEGELREDGSRTFALTEIMVRGSWRRRGYARQLHDRLLADRAEERATLLVLPDNIPAKAAYASWGWRKLGELKPFDDSPTYDAMVVSLPLGSAAGRA
jgi:ribosomal protein S18 acetylase RimI-like enzyme